MGEHQWKARRERQIGEAIAAELCRALSPAMQPEALAANQNAVCETFSRIFDQYQIADELSATRILGHVSKALARLNFELIRQGKTTP
jgi:hypothetical protein